MKHVALCFAFMLTACGEPAPEPEKVRVCASSHVETQLMPVYNGKFFVHMPRSRTVCDMWEWQDNPRYIAGEPALNPGS